MVDAGRPVFVDEAEIQVRAGSGGDGIVSLRHEKYVPRGGPDGGDGGRGGSVVAIADASLRTLIDCTHRRHYRAEDGGRGGPNRRHGRNGRDLEIRLPVGTVIYALPDRAVVADLTHADQRVVLARGGRGGKGNARFASATRQTPRFAEKAEPAEECRLRLELRLVADVGVVGLPNVGKSSLIARVSAARPKIADYPFTTLVPNLGVVRVEEGTSFVIADLPGLVEGAHAGAGRGHAFLRHAARTRVLIHMIDAAAPDRDPCDDFAVINRELALYDADLAKRPQLVALNKIDLEPPATRLAEITSSLEAEGYPVFPISAVTGEGVMRLMGESARVLEQEQLAARASVVPSPPPQPARPRREKQRARVERAADGIYEVSGEDVERTVIMTDLENEEAVRHLHRHLERMGVIRRLRALGAKDGDRVRIGEVELDFVE